MTQANSGLYTPQDDLPLNQVQNNQPELDGEDETAAALLGNNPNQTAYVDVTDVDALAGATLTDVYEGNADTEQTAGDDSYDLLIERELRAGETEDVMEAIEEGYTYLPPVDPPASLDPDADHSLDALTGSEDEDDLTAAVREALRRDSQTTDLVDQLRIATINGVVVVRGEVDDLDDTDNIVAVASVVAGVEAVRDETRVRNI